MGNVKEKPPILCIIIISVRIADARNCGSFTVLTESVHRVAESGYRYVFIPSTGSDTPKNSGYAYLTHSSEIRKALLLCVSAVFPVQQHTK